MRRVRSDAYRSVKRLVKSLYSLTVRSVYPPPQPSTSGSDAERSILVVRADGLGDLLLATPILKCLRKSYSEYRISLLVRQEWVDVIQNCPYIDEIIPWNKKKYTTNLPYRLRFLRELRRRKFGLALHPVYSRESKIDEVVCCCRAVEKIGSDGDLNNISLQEKTRNDRHYSRLIHRGSKGVVELDRNREFAEQLLGRRIVSEDFQPEIWLTESDHEKAGNLLDKAGIDPKRDLIVSLFPGASWDGKSWPASRYAELADRIIHQYGAKIVVCGAPMDVPVGSGIESEMKGSVVNLAGKTSLPVLAALFGVCALYIGSDTGPLHLGVIAGTATLGIFGGGHFGRFYPYGDLNRHRMVYKEMDCYHCNWDCIHESVRCIQEIPVADVWDHTQRMMEEVVLPEREAQAQKNSNGVVLER